MAIDAVFERPQLEQVVDVEGERLGDLAFDFYGPGARGQAAGVFRGVALVHAELVEVVVVGDVVEAGELLAGGGQRALDGLQLGSGEGARCEANSWARRSAPSAAAPAAAAPFKKRRRLR